MDQVRCMSMDKISDWLKENRITEVGCLVPDMTGNARGKFIPATEPYTEDAFQEPITVARNRVISSWEREYLLLNV